MAGIGRMPGPPPLGFTPELGARIVGKLREGNYLETAAAVCGVSAEAVRKWCQAGARGDDRYAQFAVDVEAARADFEDEAMRVIRRAGNEDWRAVAWLLERMQPKKFAARIEHTGADGGAIDLAVRQTVLVLPPEDTDSEPEAES